MRDSADARQRAPLHNARSMTPSLRPGRTPPSARTPGALGVAAGTAALAMAFAAAATGDGSRSPILVGGDLNTTTYDASSPLALLRDLLHKLFVTGFNRTVEGYMCPELGYDRPLFDVLARYGFSIEGFNDRGPGTYWYDVMSPYAVQKLHSKVGRWPTALLQRRLRPWNGVVPARLDWFLGRDVQPVGSAVIDLRKQGEPPISDHSPISVDIGRG